MPYVINTPWSYKRSIVNRGSYNGSRTAARGTKMKFESIQEMFRHAAGRFPANTAIEHGSRVTSFQDVEARATRLAGILLADGALPGQVAALLIEDAASLAVAMLAALEARCVFVPFDVAVPDRRLAALLAEIEPRWLLVEQA